VRCATLVFWGGGGFDFRRVAVGGPAEVELDADGAGEGVMTVLSVRGVLV